MTMRHGIAGLAAALLIAPAGGIVAPAGPAAAQAAGNTGLDRLSRREQVFGWEAVGRVDITGAGFCTGTLIATDLVLTAAHCLFDAARGRAHDPGQVRFRAGFRDGVSVAEGAVARAIAHPSYDPQGRDGLANLRHDVALLQLAEPIPAAVAAPFPVSAAHGVAEVSVVSYAQGRTEALSWQRVCTVLGRQAGLLAFDCDVHFGSSGAPVFDRSRGRARIVSMISAGQRDSDRAVSFGMELPALVDEMKTALRAGRGVIEAVESGTAPAPSPGGRRGDPAASGRDIGARFLRP